MSRFFRGALTALTILLCAALCVSAVRICHGGLAARTFSGDLTAPIYTRAGAGAALIRLLPLLGVWLASLVGALCARSAKKPSAPAIDPRFAVALLRCRVSPLPEKCAKEARLRKLQRILCGAVLGMAGVYALLYLAEGAHFESWDLEAVMGQALLHLLPAVAVMLLALAAHTLLEEKSLCREQAALTAALKAGRRAVPPLPLPEADRQGRGQTSCLPALRLILYACALLMLVLGVMNGGLSDVLVKAINICTECIGLG